MNCHYEDPDSSGDKAIRRSRPQYSAAPGHPKTFAVDLEDRTLIGDESSKAQSLPPYCDQSVQCAQVW